MNSQSAPLQTVRTAWPAEAADIAPIQRRVWVEEWSAAEAEALLAATDLAAMAEAWNEAITRPPVAGCRVLVALEGERVVGFAATAPSDDEDASPRDGMVAEFAIDPVARRQGHGSRLMNAAVDTLRNDGFTTATWWVRTTNDALRAFLQSAGWEPDGATRSFTSDDGGFTVKQVRLRVRTTD
ncbi:Ribosomal protein S18 acetylase RimI [Raineyella antarctica]|uniref:Ribosomal protein S18 acetylase RimI n=1 Tax=Raineyella antarctica TaxID=1577474 RepID=A0A1G6HAK9_9ACTN|nr:GNAT family N-acetyltransferase [Raineyella antarctica]SDB91310.1 Ribosomal protein S18 acetylase RimI [Raineyella antarctica]